MRTRLTFTTLAGIAALTAGCATAPGKPLPKPELDQTGCFLTDPVTRQVSTIPGCQEMRHLQAIHQQVCEAEKARFESASKVLMAYSEKANKKDLPAQNALILAYTVSLASVQRQCGLSTIDVARLFGRSIPPHVADRAANCAQAILNGQYSYDPETNSATCTLPKPNEQPAAKERPKP
jgi:hypothetical protein